MKRNLYYLLICLFGVSLGLWSCEKSDDAGPDGISGTWQRVRGPSGDVTDIAIGGITGEPDDRVYMCEHKGSSAAGLYKGTIAGEVITWDATYGLPNATFTTDGDERTLAFPSISWSIPTNYKRGPWRGECGPLENSSKKIAVGLPMSMQGTIIGASVEGIEVPLTLLTNTVTAPDCSSHSFIELPATSANADYYTTKVRYTGISVDTFQPYTREQGGVILKSQLNNGCNLFTVDDNGTGRYYFLPM
jgi:hypothetical protein